MSSKASRSEIICGWFLPSYVRSFDQIFVRLTKKFPRNLYYCHQNMLLDLYKHANLPYTCNNNPLSWPSVSSVNVDFFGLWSCLERHSLGCWRVCCHKAKFRHLTHHRSIWCSQLRCLTSIFRSLLIIVFVKDSGLFVRV